MLWIALVSLGIWTYLIAFRGGFWRFRPDPRTSGIPPHRRVVAVVPARNEAGVVGRAVGSLLRQEYPLHIFLVDDHSSDGTVGEAMAAAQRAQASQWLTVVQAAALPPGWTGKLWAVSEGLNAALATAPDYILLTDADIEHSPQNLIGLVDRAEAGEYDLVSWMVRLRCESIPEKALIPAFVYFFFQLYPPAWIAERDSVTAGAAGGCILIRTSALHRIGGIQAICGELIDDCALAAAVKSTGGSVWLGLTGKSVSLRGYKTAAEIRRMISRTAFTQLRHSAWMLAGAIAGLTITYVAPPLLAAFASGPARAAGTAATALMVISYLPAVRYFGIAPLWALLLPLNALFYAAATVDSAMRYWRGQGGQWKGRVQDARQ